MYIYVYVYIYVYICIYIHWIQKSLTFEYIYMSAILNFLGLIIRERIHQMALATYCILQYYSNSSNE